MYMHPPSHYINTYMSEKDAAIIKILTQLNLRLEPKLSDEEEIMFRNATDANADYLQNVKDIFDTNQKGKWS